MAKMTIDSSLTRESKGLIKAGKLSTSQARVQQKKIYYPGKIEGIVGVSRSLRALEGTVTYKATLIAAQLVKEVLQLSQWKVPIDTGELKQNGVARLFAKDIAKGNRQKFNDKLTSVYTPTPNDVKKRKYINLNVQYTRVNNEGQDIALWTHQNLYPYGSALRPHALTPGTGPKYLELPFKLILGKRVQALKNAIKRVDVELREVRSKRKRFMALQKIIDEQKTNAKYRDRYQRGKMM